jgi:hypothetical protein
MNKILSIFSLVVALSFTGCEQSDPSFNNRDGDVLTFAGRKWDIKIFKNSTWGPGNNYFTDHPNDIFIDDNGYLHLSITEREGKWWSSEVISQDTMGYGTYVWTVGRVPQNLDPMVVLGLFTWDSYTFQTDANSEVDIEFSKWGDPDKDTTLQYGVQPINFGPYYPERDDKPKVNPSFWGDVSTHAFTWTDTLITWESWIGAEYGNGAPQATWTFDLSNPARVKNENGNSSDPIVIPAPGSNTNARMNLWLVQGADSGPVFPFRTEIVIQDFKYTPLP